jgi:hypothetical protein
MSSVATKTNFPSALIVTPAAPFTPGCPSPAIGHDDAGHQRAGRWIAPGARDDARDRPRGVHRTAVRSDGTLVPSNEAAAGGFLAGALDAGHEGTSTVNRGRGKISRQ